MALLLSARQLILLHYINTRKKVKDFRMDKVFEMASKKKNLS
ncbi:hypothetical protein M23134_01467 [Microscilla marina ATCC 23134]|uniref:Uncharacterized protein n=1 Tax=Microscilla marina ATCC 23134 TaxID=313606 RepID=A1ZJV4_MICM2|nr:hypothetical protein M23134_01467 [Microscilla marina ATCC 23134]